MRSVWPGRCIGTPIYRIIFAPVFRDTGGLPARYMNVPASTELLPRGERPVAPTAGAGRPSEKGDTVSGASISMSGGGACFPREPAARVLHVYLPEERYAQKAHDHVDEAVYDGLYRTVGARRISAFIENLVRPHVIREDLSAAYARDGRGRVARSRGWRMGRIPAPQPLLMQPSTVVDIRPNPVPEAEE